MGILSLLWMVVVGFIVGALARWLYPGAIPLSFLMTVLLGIGGSLIGGILSSFVFSPRGGKFHPGGLIMSILGAMILLYAYLNFFK